MSDLTIPIVFLTTLAGYFFSTKEKTPRTVENRRDKIEEFEKPVGTNIYESNKVEEVNKEMLERSAAMYEKAQNPAVTGVLPPLFNTYSAVGNNSILTASGRSNNQIHEQSAIEQSRVLEINKRVDVTQKSPVPVIESRPMFKPVTDYIGRERPQNLTSDVPTSLLTGLPLSSPTVHGAIEKFTNRDGDSNLSLLTGLPLDATHKNMTPFFGGSIKQNTNEFRNETILDLHTGNTSTFKHKQEVGKFFSEQGQDIYGTPILTNTIDTDRYVPSLYRQGEKPFNDKRESAQIAGTVDNKIRPSFKNIDELNVRQQETYEGRTVAGQMGDVRGVQSEFNKRRPETFYEKGFDHLFKTTGGVLGPKAEEDYSNLKATSRKDYNIEYVGGSSAVSQKDRQQFSRKPKNQFDSLIQEPKRNNFDNDYQRNVSGHKTTNDYGKSGMSAYETERATTGLETHLSNAHKATFGMRTSLSDMPKSTIKETTLSFDNSGHIKTQFNQGSVGAYNSGVSNIEAKTTQKESTLMNNYKGVMSKEKGMGYLVNKYEAKTTGKEINSNNDYIGIATAESEKVTSRVNYNNAEIRDYKESILTGARAPGPQYFKTTAGAVSHGDIKETENMLLKEREDDRVKMNVNVQQSIPDKHILGVKTKLRFDDEAEDTVFADRLQPDLVIGQHSQNPYSLYGK